MKIELPEYQESFKGKITPEAYDRLRLDTQKLLDRAVAIIAAYDKTKDWGLYDLYTLVVRSLQTSVKLMAKVSPTWLDAVGTRLYQDGETEAWYDNHKATMLMDLGAAMRCI